MTVGERSGANTNSLPDSAFYRKSTTIDFWSDVFDDDTSCSV